MISRGGETTTRGSLSHFVLAGLLLFPSAADGDEQMSPDVRL